MKKLKEKKAGRALKRLLATAVVGVVTLTMLPLTTASTAYAKTGHDEIDVTLLQDPRVEIVTRKTIEFGTYLQEDQNNDSVIDWNDATPITWQILDDSDSTNVLIVADKILDCKNYNESSYKAWNESDLRDWLNGNDQYAKEEGQEAKSFIDKAFTSEEKSLINDTSIQIKAIDDSGATSSILTKTTTDKIFLLSLDDVLNASYGFNTDANYRDEARSTEVTSYAKNQGAFCHQLDGTDAYWLLSPNVDYFAYTTVVDYDGVVDLDCPMHEEGIGVRPALRINLQEAGLEVKEQYLTIKNVDYDTITMGENNGSILKWFVLDLNDNNAFVFSDSDNNLPNDKKYNYAEVNVVWKDCDIREWLNGDFYSNAFTEVERSSIIRTEIDNKYGGMTTDDLFFLSVDEFTNADFGFTKKSACYSEARTATKMYWTRQGNDNKTAIVVLENGIIRDGSYLVSNTFGIRPAMHVDISKLCKLDNIKSVNIEGTDLRKDTDYTVRSENGKIIFSLKSGLLDSLTAGKHTLNVTFDDNNGTVTTTGSVFYVKPLLKITADSEIKTYDGTALTVNAYTVTGLLDGDKVESVTISGSQTLIGSSENVVSNVKIVDADGNDVTDNYDITFVNGTLTVTDYPGELYTNNSTTSSWQKGSGKSLELVFKRAVADEQSYDYFVSNGHLEVDGKTLTLGNEYTASKGSIKISILPDYLETLETGEHTIKLVLPDGSIQTEISILAANESVNSTAAPYTGDDSHLTAYVIVCILAAAGGAMIVVSNKLKEE